MRLGENIRKLIELAAKQTQWFPADTVNKQVRAIWRSGDMEEHKTTKSRRHGDFS